MSSDALIRYLHGLLVMKDPSIFICYSHKDTAYVDRLVTFLDGFQLKGFFMMWDDRQIQHGKEWLAEINEAIKNASIAVLMISADFLASEFIRDQELPEIRRRMEQFERMRRGQRRD